MDFKFVTESESDSRQNLVLAMVGIIITQEL